MKITIKQLLDADTALQKVFNIDSKESALEAKQLYALMRDSKWVRSELTDIVEMRNKLWDKYAKKDIKGNYENEIRDGRMQIVFKDRKGFNKEWNPFIETEIELDFWLIPFDVLIKANLTPAEMAMVEPFIKDMPEEEPVKPKDNTVAEEVEKK